MTCMLDAYKCMGANMFFVCFARETLGTKNAKCKRGCSFSFASETLGTKKKSKYKCGCFVCFASQMLVRRWEPELRSVNCKVSNMELLETCLGQRSEI